MARRAREALANGHAPGRPLADGPLGAAKPSNLAAVIELPPELVELVAQRVAEIIDERAAQTASSAGWLDSAGAAVYLDCSRDRIHDLVSLGKLSPRRDGRRLLFRRGDLDAYLEAAA